MKQLAAALVTSFALVATAHPALADSHSRRTAKKKAAAPVKAIPLLFGESLSPSDLEPAQVPSDSARASKAPARSMYGSHLSITQLDLGARAQGIPDVTCDVTSGDREMNVAPVIVKQIDRRREARGVRQVRLNAGPSTTPRAPAAVPATSPKPRATVAPVPVPGESKRARLP